MPRNYLDSIEVTKFQSPSNRVNIPNGLLLNSATEDIAKGFNPLGNRVNIPNRLVSLVVSIRTEGVEFQSPSNRVNIPNQVTPNL